MFVRQLELRLAFQVVGCSLFRFVSKSCTGRRKIRMISSFNDFAIPRLLSWQLSTDLAYITSQSISVKPVRGRNMSVQPEFSLGMRYVRALGRSTTLAHEVGTVLDVADRGVDGLGSISNQKKAEGVIAMG
jgi:hypothetical protein